MVGVIGAGLGVAAAAFFVRSKQVDHVPLLNLLQGRAGLVAFRKYRAGTGAISHLTKTYYKGGFEPKMNRREAALILQLR